MSKKAVVKESVPAGTEKPKGTKVYLAGPMQGIAHFNFPLFMSVAVELRAKGFDVVNPAELDDIKDYTAAMNSTTGNIDEAHRTWGEYLARDVRILADDGVEGIVFLPNWNHSKGAKLEACVGLMIPRFRFWNYDVEYNQITPVHPNMVALEVYNQWKIAKGKENNHV